MSSKARPDTGAKETVLLRQARPKYSFNARKLPKSPSHNSGSGISQDARKYAAPSGTKSNTFSSTINSTSNSSAQNGGRSSQQTGGHTFPARTDGQKPKPIAVVGASLQSSPPSSRSNDKSNTTEQWAQATNTTLDDGHSPVSMSVISDGLLDARSSHKQDIPGMAVTEISQSPLSGAFHSSPNLTQLSKSISGSASISGAAQQSARSSQQLHTSQTVALPLNSLTQDSPDFQTRDENTRSDVETYESLEQERNKLKRDLDVQLQVNAELKRLLVASVGEDLSERVERLCRDRAQLSLDLGGYSKKMTEEYENLDKVSIQADMWRSKYLASRVMTEELGNARAYYSLQCHDAQDALQQLLNERHELRTNLLEAYKVLQQVKNAFDPLNSHRSSTLRSTNVLDLSRSSQQLAEAIRFRLLPANVAINIDVEMEDQVWRDCVTRAEQFAHEILSRPLEPVGSLQSGSSRLLPVTGSSVSSVTRFHPHTRDENLTYNCCAHCKGEINVI